ncbi:MAG TPA: flagellar basal-body rod protein FlgF [Lachnospiraceae bacterium]|nr:flagellar basal-body rod protein FlgF [Lachnospiraceae bacterium]
MLKGLYIASTGMLNEQRRVDTMSNNLANSTTAGFKKEGTTAEAFHDVLALKIKDTSEPGIARRLGHMNMGVKIGENYTDFSQGPFHETMNKFDLAISGDGFFSVEFQNKAGDTDVKYTRDGAFTLNVRGELVNKNGDFLLDVNGNHIVLDPTQDYSIDRMGNIRAAGAEVTLAQINVVNFADYNFLEKYGETYFQPVEGAEFAPTDAQIYSGYIETSNVQTVHEMVDLIAFQRAYESNQKIIQTYDESLGIAVEQLGRLQ